MIVAVAPASCEDGLEGGAGYDAEPASGDGPRHIEESIDSRFRRIPTGKF